MVSEVVNSVTGALVVSGRRSLGCSARLSGRAERGRSAGGLLGLVGRPGRPARVVSRSGRAAC